MGFPRPEFRSSPVDEIALIFAFTYCISVVHIISCIYQQADDILYPLSYDVIDLEYLIQIYLPLDLAFSLCSCSQSGTVYDT